jgi:hypothetical protein
MAAWPCPRRPLGPDDVHVREEEAVILTEEGRLADDQRVLAWWVHIHTYALLGASGSCINKFTGIRYTC